MSLNKIANRKLGPGSCSGKMEHALPKDEQHLYPPYDETPPLLKTLKEKGVWRAKIDGRNIELVIEDGEVHVYIRYQDSKGLSEEECEAKGLVRIPEGGNPVTWDGDGTAKLRTYYLRQVTREEHAGLGKAEAGRIMDLVEAHTPYLMKHYKGKIISCELVGKNYNNTPFMDTKVDIAIHTEQRQFNVRESDPLDVLRKYVMEGLVVTEGNTCHKILAHAAGILDFHIYSRDRSHTFEGKPVPPVLLSQELGPDNFIEE